MSDSVQPQRRQPARLPHPWASPGKNTGVGCYFLLQCMKVKSEREVAQPCPTPSDPMDCSPPDFSIRGIFQARLLEWDAIAFSESNYRWVLIQYDWCHFNKGKLGQIYAEREDNVKRQKEKTAISKPRREAWNSSFPHGPQKKLNTTNTLILNF